MKSCANCNKEEVCKFKPDAPCSIRLIIFPIDFRSMLFELYGSHCMKYSPKEGRTTVRKDEET